MISPANAPYHAHIYVGSGQEESGAALRARFASEPHILFVGRITEGKAGPHPISQFEVHFLQSSLDAIIPLIDASGLRSLIHPLTEDDLADHTTLAHWIGSPIELDLTTLDPRGVNQGVARFGKSDF